MPNSTQHKSFDSVLPENLQRKVEASLLRIGQAVSQFYNGLYVGHSGGKDSVVITHLTRLVCPSVRIVHNPKPDIHPDTKTFIQEMAKIFLIDFVDPNEMQAFLKYHHLTAQVDGTREAEFDRLEKSTTYISNGVDVSRKGMGAFTENGIFGLTLIYPIFDWTDAEVFDYIRCNNLPLSKEYNSEGVKQ